AAKRVLRYLKGTTNYGIKYSAEANGYCLYGFCDADYAGDLDSRRSTSGYVFIMSGGAISWMSRVQRIVALSTTEAEYIALAEAAKEAFWLRQLLVDLSLKQAATRILCDNQGAIKLVGNPEFHQRTKHIDVRHNFIRDAQSDGKITVQYVDTKKQAAGFLTKLLNSPQFVMCRETVNCVEFAQQFRAREGVDRVTSCVLHSCVL
ncbi:RxLR effector candidate protein-like protein, partial [Leptotrombidium deliense]